MLAHVRIHTDTKQIRKSREVSGWCVVSGFVFDDPHYSKDNHRDKGCGNEKMLISYDFAKAESQV